MARRSFSNLLALFSRRLWLLVRACLDSETPLGARLLGLAALIYALSPIDLLPDVLPFVGILDDLIIVPLLLSFVWRRIPESVKSRYSPAQANSAREPKTATSVHARRFSEAGLILVICWLIWLWLV